MPINDFEIASVCGALDEAAVGSGRPFAAHSLRAIATTANRLATKGEEVLNLVWPITKTFDAEVEGYSNMVNVPLSWMQLLPPMPVPKMPGLTSAALFVKYRTDGEDDLWIQAATRAAPFDPRATPTTSPNVKQITGRSDGAYTTNALTGIPVDPGDFEAVSFYVRGTALGLITVGGTPTSGAQYDSLVPYGMADLSASWTASTSTSSADFASQGGYLIILDSDDNPVIEPRRIVRVDSGTELHFEPWLSHTEIGSASVAYSGGAGGGTYEIHALPQASFAQLLLYTEDRT